MIIVEGPDGAGKSTLVRALATRLRYPIAPRVVDKDTKALVDLQRWVDANLLEGFQPVIYDRHRLISEPIYGPIIRPGTNNDFFNTHWLQDVMDQFYCGVRPILIYCLPSRSTVKANLTGDPDNAVPLPHIDAIYDLYCARAAMDMARGNDLWVHTYDYRNTRPSELDRLMDALGGYVTQRMDSN